MSGHAAAPCCSECGAEIAAGLLAWAAGEGRTMQDVDLDVERPTGFIRRIVNFLKERV